MTSLHLGKYTNKELAEWFGIKTETFTRYKKKKLEELNIPILAEDTGENYGRTVIFYPETGDFVIRAVGKTEKVI